MKTEIVAVVAILAAWILLMAIGSIIWETPIDTAQGIGLVVFGIIIGGGCLYHELEAKNNAEYDEWGDYIGK